MKNIFVIFLLICVSYGFSQNAKYLTKNGNINFEASVPSFEEVKAKNESVTAILNTENGEIAALALIKGFRFKNALMEEHFNENYIESDTYPKATFKGKLQDFDINTLKDTYSIKGTLSLHGKSKEITIDGTLQKDENTILLSSLFSLNPQDFDIQIPGVVRKKIAEEVTVSFDFILKVK